MAKTSIVGSVIDENNSKPVLDEHDSKTIKEVLTSGRALKMVKGSDSDKIKPDKAKQKNNDTKAYLLGKLNTLASVKIVNTNVEKIKNDLAKIQEIVNNSDDKSIYGDQKIQTFIIGINAGIEGFYRVAGKIKNQQQEVEILTDNARKCMKYYSKLGGKSKKEKSKNKKKDRFSDTDEMFGDILSKKSKKKSIDAEFAIIDNFLNLSKKQDDLPKNSWVNKCVENGASGAAFTAGAYIADKIIKLFKK